MAKQRLRDLVILIPGITGSVLQQDGRDVWAISRAAIWPALTRGRAALEALRLGDDDPERDDLGDGVTAPRLIDDVHLIPGLIKIDGYRRLVQLLHRRFQVVPGTADDDRPANFVPFPYDWRRHNRATARRLQQVIERKLRAWRGHSGAADARVIILAHSMGGLIARYYLEALDGWRDCRALITFGTPYRGALGALNFLVNGYKNRFGDLSDLVRSFTSVYQLLPLDPVVQVDATYRTVDTLPELMGLDAARVQAARTFHKDIHQSVRRRMAGGGNYTLLPVVGSRQPTLQSARLVGGRLIASADLPDGYDPLLGDGDGTVPLVSAIPPELTGQYYDTFFPARHASLQAVDAVLALLDERIRRMQMTIPPLLLGPTPRDPQAERPAIALALDDLYLAGEDAIATARIVGEDIGAALEATIAPLDGGPPIVRTLHQQGDRWELPLAGLAPGGYRLTVQSDASGGPLPIQDLFVIAPALP